MKKRYWKKVLVAGGAVAAAAVAKKTYEKKARRQHQKEVEESLRKRNYGERQAYILGNELAALSAAVYLIRDARFPADHIHVFSNDPIVKNFFVPETGFVCQKICFCEEQTFENCWELLNSLPSGKKRPKTSVGEEIRKFSESHPIHAKARLVDETGKIVDAESLGLNQEERMRIAKLLMSGEEELEGQTIEQWFASSHFFTTNFWHLWSSTFGIREKSGIMDFRRLLQRKVLNFGDLDTMDWMRQPPYAPQEDFYLNLWSYLVKKGVIFEVQKGVESIDLTEDGVRVCGLWIREKENVSHLKLAEDDLLIVTDGDGRHWCEMGDWNRPAVLPPEKKYPAQKSFWALAAQKRPGLLGSPNVFLGNPDHTEEIQFTLTSRGNTILRRMEKFTGNQAGTGGFVTLKDSPWKITLIVPVQPYFMCQQPEETVILGFGQAPECLGEKVKKPMRECAGKEIFEEILACLHWEDIKDRAEREIINLTMVRWPYARAPYEPHSIGDRVSVMPDPDGNLAFAGWFCEMPEEIAGGEECKVRSARMAVYSLLKIDKEILPVTPYRKDAKILAKALYAVYR